MEKSAEMFLKASEVRQEDFQSLLLLAQSDEYSYDEIATMLRAPVGTIKWRVFEARRVVRATLRQRGYVDVR
jgi:DNA-directed RNA polymerase specialized sigma24 family protein